MEENKNYLQDIKDIKNMMSQSSQFISLSGLSGVMAGIFALIGAFCANQLIQNFNRTLQLSELTNDGYSFLIKDIELNLLIISGAVLLASIITAYFLTLKKAKKQKIKIWNPTSRKLLLSFALPLITGGIFGLLLLKNEYWNLIAPITMIFYGLACENASKFTFRQVRYLGISLILLGLISVYFPGYGLHFWALGFGVCHILYGAIMYFKYDK